MTERNKILIAIAGDSASGKDTIGDMFSDAYGFSRVSCGDYVRSHIRENGLGNCDRQNCTKVASDLRAAHGATFIVDRCLEASAQIDRRIITGIYSPVEALRVKDVGGFVVVTICRDDRMRFARVQDRDEERDNLTFEQFMECKARESSGNNQQQNVGAIEQMADFHIVNESTYDSARAQVHQVFSKICEVSYAFAS